MQMTDILARSGGLQAMARELGISESDAARGASGLGGLASMLDMNRDGNPLDDLLKMAGR